MVGCGSSSAGLDRSKGAPHEEQKLAPLGLRWPHRLQYKTSSLEELPVILGRQQALERPG